MASEQFVDSTVEIAQQVPAVGYLFGLRSPQAAGLDINVATVTADDLHARMRLEPGHASLDLAIRQEVNGDQPFEIKQQRSLAFPFTVSPIVEL